MPPVLGRKRRIGRRDRLGQRRQRAPHRAHDVVAGVDDVEGDQPGHDRRDDDDQLVEIEGENDDVEYGPHGRSYLA